MKKKLVYFGTPELAVPPLKALLDSKQFEVLAVVTQTDKPAGRGNKISESPVKQFALSSGIPVFQPTSLKKLNTSENSLAFSDFLSKSPGIDAFVVVAYGKIIPLSLIQLPRFGVINIHLSLLPRWRGAAPIQRAILAGDTESGISIMQIDEGLDTGPVYSSAKVSILPSDDTGSLTEKLLEVGNPLLIQTLSKVFAGEITPTTQNTEGVTYAEKLQKSDFKINWELPASVINCQIRAGSPAPGAFSNLEGEQIKIFSSLIVPDNNFPLAAPGTIVEVTKESIVVSCGSGSFLSLKELQFPGKKRMKVNEILRGKIIKQFARFNSSI